MGEIGVEDASAEFSAIARDAVKVVQVGVRIEIRDEGAVLIDRGLDNEHIDAARKSGSHHFPPFCFVARAAIGTLTVTCQKILAVAFLKDVFDFLRAKEGPVLGILDTV